jgi:hypothetical protein
VHADRAEGGSRGVGERPCQLLRKLVVLHEALGGKQLILQGAHVAGERPQEMFDFSAERGNYDKSDRRGDEQHRAERERYGCPKGHPLAETIDQRTQRGGEENSGEEQYQRRERSRDDHKENVGARKDGSGRQPTADADRGRTALRIPCY